MDGAAFAENFISCGVALCCPIEHIFSTTREPSVHIGIYAEVIAGVSYLMTWESISHWV